MTVTEEVVGSDSIVRIRLSGTATPAWIRTVGGMFDRGFSLCQEKGCGGLLFDVRNLDLQIGILDRFDAGVAAAKSQKPRIRVALLGRPDHLLPDRFFQTVAQNRGAILRVVTEESEALRWLNGPESRP